MKIIILFIVLISVIRPEGTGKTSIVMPSIFSDNMVLQRNTEVPFWGKANPGETVSVTSGWGASAEAIVKNDSLWKAELQTQDAGGPFEVKIQIGDSIIEYKNVMLGEVWLCSGQSNMEMPLEGWPPQNTINNSAEEIKEADYPNIRLFTVTRAVSNKPEFNCIGRWSECSPQTAAKFSAAAYFFGRKLYNELKVPIGLIHSSWGGTYIESWTSAEYLKQLDKYKPVISKLSSAADEVKKLNDWIFGHPVIDISSKKPEDQWKGLDFNDADLANPGFDDSLWKTMKLPIYWESTEVGDFDGVVWFRKKVQIPSSWIDKDLVLNLGPIDDMDRSFVNGKLVGATEEVGYYQMPRIYNIPKTIINDTTLTIAVRVVDNQGGGGIWGNNVKMLIHPAGADSNESISISGEWKYLPVAEYANGKFYLYNIKNQEFYSRPKTSITIGPNTPTMLYNGMIAPLIPYHIKGVIWYQGENNVGYPESYKVLFPLMIKNWRNDWNEGDFPFYYVQIAPYNYGDNSRSQVIREAQLLTLSVPNTGMAVTLDIGETNSIHPGNKQDVGKRLALWALAKDYGKDVTFSGPIYKSMKIENNEVIITFDYADNGLVLKPVNGENNFIIAGADSNFVEADVKVDGNQLIVSSSQIKNPVAVRYAWSNTAQATLFNKEDLPASTFKTDDWGK